MSVEVTVRVSTSTGTPPRTYPPGRLCSRRDCGTVLSIYNAGPHCRAHTGRQPVVGNRVRERASKGTSLAEAPGEGRPAMKPERILEPIASHIPENVNPNRSTRRASKP